MVDFSSLINTSSTGRTTISGLSSGIDTKALIDASVNARRFTTIKPVEDKVTANVSLLAAYGEFKTLVADFTTKLDTMRGNSSFFTEDIFDKKLAFTTSAENTGAPADHIVSDSANLVGVTVTADAQAANHTLVINQLAQAHQLRADSVTSTTNALVNDLGKTAGSFTINGQTITLSATDSLLDLESQINNSNAGVNATIVSASDSSHFLVLTSADEGLSNAITFGGTAAVTDSLGFTSTGSIKNELTVAQDSIIEVDGITGIQRSTNEIDDVIDGVTLSLFKAEPDTVVDIDISADLNGIKTAIADFVDSYNAIKDFVTAQKQEIDRDEDGDEEFGPLAFNTTVQQILGRLGQIASVEVTGQDDGFRSLSQIGVTIGEDFRMSINDAVIDNKLITNVEKVKDLFTFNFKASDSRIFYVSNTDATSDISTSPGADILAAQFTDADDYTGTGSLWTVVDAVVDSTTITAPNGDSTAVRISGNSASDGAFRSNNITVEANTTYTMSFYAKGFTGSGVLAGIYDATNTTDLTTLDYEVYATGSDYDRVAVTFTTGGTTAEIQLDPARMLNTSDTIDLWGIKLEEGNTVTTYKNGPDIYYLNIGGTDGSGNVTSANIVNAVGLGAGGADDGSMTVSGQAITATDQHNSNGMKILFNGAASLGAVNGIRLEFSRGLADLNYNFFDDLTKLQGVFDDLTSDITNQQVDFQAQITLAESRLDTFQANLERRYTAMEVALLKMEALQDQIKALVDAQNNN